MPVAVPQPPTRVAPFENDWRYPLWQDVKEALAALPAYFSTPTTIEGLRATDIFALGGAVGATIEDQVVETLNGMRSVWDPGGEFSLYRFVRQPQTFPDVLLRKVGNPDPAFGIELKGWYLLAKEGEPSYRYKVTPSACADWDLIAVVPWYLSNVIAGTPRVIAPYIEQARYAAEYRNYHWQNVRVSKLDKTITSPTGVQPYPKKSDLISDRPAADDSNFGRLARSGLTDAFIEELETYPIAGIEAKYWREFFKMFQEREDPERIIATLRRMSSKARKAQDAKDEARAKEILEAVLSLLQAGPE